YHTKHTNNTAAHYLNITKQYGLLVTGGSDCHGLTKGKPLIGGIKLPIHYVHKLQKAQAKRTKVANVH
ncbi:MAG: hypothetical protein RLY20_2058, partial [Verrucomicrobiota bacterium]